MYVRNVFFFLSHNLQVATVLIVSVLTDFFVQMFVSHKGEWEGSTCAKPLVLREKDDILRISFNTCWLDQTEIFILNSVCTVGPSVSFQFSHSFCIVPIYPLPFIMQLAD